MSSGEATAFSNLFSSISIGEKTLSNRAALVATVTNYARANRITDRWIDFLVERARGGTGMVITEVIAVDPDARAQGSTVTGYDDDNIEGFKRAARKTQAAGGRLLGQLWHPGRQQLWLPGASPKGVSDQPDAYSWTVPHVMTEPELERCHFRKKPAEHCRRGAGQRLRQQLGLRGDGPRQPLLIGPVEAENVAVPESLRRIDQVADRP